MPWECHGGLEVHELIPRDAWRDGYLIDDNCVTLCADHHRWVTNNPDDAHKIGLHGYSWERPKDD